MSIAEDEVHAEVIAALDNCSYTDVDSMSAAFLACVDFAREELSLSDEQIRAMFETAMVGP